MVIKNNFKFTFQKVRMPELPDVQIFSGNLKKLFAGKQLRKIVLINGKKLKDSQQQLSKALEGFELKDVYRSGKELRFLFSNGDILGMHLMLTGDIFVFDKVNVHKFTIVEMHFKDGSGIALTDRMRNANIKLGPVDKDGIDVFDKKFTLKYLTSILHRKSKIKDLLIDQDFIRGIGNGYADEILWETKISPYSNPEAIPGEKLSELIKNVKKVMKKAIAQISKKYPDIIQGEIKEFLKIHTRKKTESPTGFPIIIDNKSSRKTYYTEEQVLYK